MSTRIQSPSAYALLQQAEKAAPDEDAFMQDAALFVREHHDVPTLLQVAQHYAQLGFQGEPFRRFNQAFFNGLATKARIILGDTSVVHDPTCRSAAMEEFFHWRASSSSINGLCIAGRQTPLDHAPAHAVIQELMEDMHGGDHTLESLHASWQEFPRMPLDEVNNQFQALIYAHRTLSGKHGPDAQSNFFFLVTATNGMRMVPLLMPSLPSLVRESIHFNQLSFIEKMIQWKSADLPEHHIRAIMPDLVHLSMDADVKRSQCGQRIMDHLTQRVDGQI